MITTLNRLKQVKPLILNITNSVSMEFVANGLLSLGASPIMSNATHEMADLMKLAHAVVINIGTLNDDFIALCQYTCQLANQHNKPIILDPVGAGASHYRTQSCLSLIKNHQIAIIRGNASEIMALSSAVSATKGVDSTCASTQAISSAQSFSKLHDTAILISGEIDIVIDHEQIEQISGGSALMPTITGTGCLLSATVAAFHAVEKDRFSAAQQAASFYGKCGEIAESKASAPGSFRPHFLDALFSSHLPNRANDE